LLTQLVTMLRIHVATLRSQYTTRFLLFADLRNFCDAIGHDAEEHARQPDREYAQRIEDHGLLKLRHLARRQTEDQDVWKRDRRQRDERVAEKVIRRDPFAREQPRCRWC